MLMMMMMVRSGASWQWADDGVIMLISSNPCQWGVSKSCKYKFTCEFTDYKICKFEISVNLHHQIPVICEVSDIINITNFITTQNPITKRKWLSWRKVVVLRRPPSLWGLVFSLLWGKICEWFKFPLTECFDNDDDCDDHDLVGTARAARVMIVCGIITRRQNIDWYFVQNIIILGEMSYIWVVRRQYWHFSGCIFITFTFQ